MDKSSLYRIVLSYVNPSEEPIVGEIIATPDNPTDVEQKSKVRFEPDGNLVTVSAGSVPAAFYFNPGRWQFTIKVQDYLMIDYFVLLPAAYYEASILQKSVREPCLLDMRIMDATKMDSGRRVRYVPNPCIKLQYPSLGSFETVRQDKAYILKNGEKNRPRKFYTDGKVAH